MTSQPTLRCGHVRIPAQPPVPSKLHPYQPTGPDLAPMNDRRIMASTTNAPLANGRLIADRYQLLGLLGSGGMAEVWRARDEQLERDVAIKLLHAESGQLGEVSAAIDEARMAARLVHPNIVRVYDVGTD